jgi:hypothetical protein
MITSVTEAVLMNVTPFVNSLFFSDFNQSFLFSAEFSKTLHYTGPGVA